MGEIPFSKIIKHSNLPSLSTNYSIYKLLTNEALTSFKEKPFLIEIFLKIIIFKNLNPKILYKYRDNRNYCMAYYYKTKVSLSYFY